MKRGKACARRALWRFRARRPDSEATLNYLANLTYDPQHAVELLRMLSATKEKRHWIFDGENFVPADVWEVTAWMEAGKNSLFFDFVPPTQKDNYVSTAFIPFSFPPYHFETMIFYAACPFDRDAERYTSYADAREGHARHVKRVEAWLGGL